MYQWEASLEALAAECRPMALNLPIFAPALAAPSIAALGQHITRFLDALDIARVVLDGNSLGGHVALHVALTHPERVGGLILTGSSGLFEQRIAGRAPHRPSSEYVRARMEEVFCDASLVTPAWVEAVRRLVTERATARRVLRFAKAAKRDNVAGRLGNIRVPTLVVWGQEDRVTPLHVGERFHALMARGWFFMYFALFAAAAARGMRERVLWVGVIALLCFVSCATAAFLFRSTPAFFKVDEAVPLKAGQTLRYELTLGAEMLDAVRRQLSKDDELAVFLRGPHEKDKFNVSIYVGDKELSFAYRDIGKYVIRNAALPLNSLSHSDKLVVQVTNAMDHDTFLLSWQRGNLSRRKCTYLDGNGGSGDTSPNLLPALELRLLRSNGRCTLAGF
jgi:hypothetical protein